mmetsp:Transcript_49469/g.146113  ORF Transcript_49469/g.146113 Transcript_49469/m.146113 type:complete len:257 (+) Transcript_49469:820-1590(+)
MVGWTGVAAREHGWLGCSTACVKTAECWHADSRAPMRRSRRASSSLSTRLPSEPGRPVTSLSLASTSPTRLAISQRRPAATLLRRSASSTRSSASSSPTHAASATCSALPRPEEPESCFEPGLLALSKMSTWGLEHASDSLCSARSALLEASSVRQLRSASAVQRSPRSLLRSWPSCASEALQEPTSSFTEASTDWRRLEKLSRRRVSTSSTSFVRSAKCFASDVASAPAPCPDCERSASASMRSRSTSRRSSDLS